MPSDFEMNLMPRSLGWKAAMSKLHGQMRALRYYAEFHDMNEAVVFIDQHFPNPKIVASDGRIVELPPMPEPPDPPRAA